MNGVNVLWDVGAAFLPFIPGSYVRRGGKIVLKVADKAGDLKKGKKLTSVGKYKALSKVIKNRKKTGIEIHHIIEKRFKKLNLKAGDYPAIPMSKKLHNTITARWRKAIPYRKRGGSYENITKNDLLIAINKVYYDMPELKKAAIETVNKYYKKKRGR